MKFDTKNFNQFRADFSEAVKGLEEKYGVVISMGNNITYDKRAGIFTSKLEVVNGSSKEEVEKAKFESDVECFSSLYEVGKADYRKAFTLKGKTYYLIGFKTRARKTPCIIEDDNGKKYSCSFEVLGIGIRQFKVTVVK